VTRNAREGVGPTKLPEILKQDTQGIYHATEGLFRMVEDLAWKPSSRTNWMSTAPWGGPEVTLFQPFTSMMWHLGRHKGQLFYYLKLQGKNVNTMHLWGG
jgi:hypothetical protein